MKLFIERSGVNKQLNPSPAQTEIYRLDRAPNLEEKPWITRFDSMESPFDARHTGTELPMKSRPIVQFVSRGDELLCRRTLA